MAPLQAVCCPLAAIGLSGLFAAWARIQQQRNEISREKRERVAYLLWVAATRG